MAALRIATRQLPAHSARTIAVLGRNAALSQSVRFQSSVPVDPKAKASSLLDALPGNSVVSKTGFVTLGTALAGLAISKELFVVNEEIIVLGSFVVLAGYISTVVQTPYKEWAEGQIQKVKNILNGAREEHTNAVRSRIESVGEMKDVVGITRSLFELSKETAKLEHESYVLKQRVDVASEVKSVLDSWVRFESQAREAEQRELVRTVIEKVFSDLRDPRLQREILEQSAADIEGLVKNKAI